MRVLKVVLALTAVGLLAYLLFTETPVEPIAWQSPSNPKFSGAFASNGALARTDILVSELPGAEALLADERGRLTTGLLDGRIVRFNPAKLRYKLLGNTGGRPLGIKRNAEGKLIIADASKGLLQYDESDESFRTLATSYQGKPLGMIDDVDILPNGIVLFTDASTRFRLGEFELDALEHSSTGRLFSFDPTTKRIKLLWNRLSFANGVAAAGDGSYALVCETWSYRIRRIFLSGPKRGTSDILIDNLPAFPDNISYDRERDYFWVGLASPRDAGLDLLAPLPFVRRMVARLPKSLHPKAARHGMIMAIRGNGKVVKFMDDPRDTSFSPITSVARIGDTLYFGSFQHAGIGRLRGGAR